MTKGARTAPPGGERAHDRGPRRRRAGHPADERVEFMIAGVQKAGTSTLFATLGLHPAVAAGRKELHYFDDDTLDWARPPHHRYHRKLPFGVGGVVGEASPSYLFWPHAMERIAAYNPGMKVILSFRDPIARAFSHWCMISDRRNGRLPGFADAIRGVGTIKPGAVVPGGRRDSYVARGLYGGQLRRALDLFPREQLLLLDYHVAFASLSATLDRMTDFLGIDRLDLPSEVHERPRAAGLAYAAPGRADIELLAGLYRDDLQWFGELSGLAVSQWPTARIGAGRLDPAEYAAQFSSANRRRPAGGGPGPD